MNDTKPIDKSQKGKGKSGFAAAAGAAAAAGIGGAAAGYAASGNGSDEPQPQENAALQDASPDVSQSQQSQQPASPQPQQQATPQPQASSEEFVAGGDDIVISLEEPEVPEEPVETGHVTEPEEPVAVNPGGEPVVEPEPEPEPVNPDEIAEAIISEEMIDPNDIDMADVVSFEEIGTVYNVYGEAMTTASFHDEYGNQLTMIDLDNDNVFDVLGDEHGNPFVDEQGDVVALNTGTTVDDVELEIHDDDTYLAADDSGDMDDFGADSLAQDMLG